MKVPLVLIICLAALGCRKAGDESVTLKAEVRLITNDCSPLVLDFSEDSSAIRRFTGREDLVWAPRPAPIAGATQGQKLYVKISRQAPQSEICTALWRYYPRIKVLEVRNRN